MIRVQRRRTPGWRMPEGTVYVGRPSTWGNQFRVARYQSAGRDAAIERFRAVAAERAKLEPDWLAPLRGASALACWCPLDRACHADVLIELLA